MTRECCCPTCDDRMIELIKAIDDLRRSLERRQDDIAAGVADSYYWEHG
jgi:hypothetical protein